MKIESLSDPEKSIKEVTNVSSKQARFWLFND